MIVYSTLNVLDPGDTLAKYNPYDTETSACWKIPVASIIPPYRILARASEDSRIVGKISVTKTYGVEMLWGLRGRSLHRRSIDFSWRNINPRHTPCFHRTTPNDKNNENDEDHWSGRFSRSLAPSRDKGTSTKIKEGEEETESFIDI